ncbi:MAG: hypothetical protein ACN4G0_14200 [Polyangiales bacterium]
MSGGGLFPGAAGGDLVLLGDRATFNRMAGESDNRTALKSWLQQRLVEGERPRKEWRQLVEATWNHLLATPVNELVHADVVKRVADEMLDTDFVIEIARPIVPKVAGAVITELRQDERPLSRLLPPDARAKLQEAIARPGLVHPDWVRAMFRGEAAEAVVNDALYRALKDFSTLLPRMMMKLSPVGRFGMLGSAGAFAEKLIDDMQRRIEPEIKSFLAESTQPVLERAAEFTISRIDDPASTEFRATFINFVLSKSPAFLLEAADDELIGDMGAVVELSAEHVTRLPEMRADIHRWIDQALGPAAGKTVGEFLGMGSTAPQPPFDALAEATWPAFTSVLRSPHAQAWMDSLVDELLDEYERLASS